MPASSFLAVALYLTGSLLEGDSKVIKRPFLCQENMPKKASLQLGVLGEKNGVKVVEG